MRWLYSAYSVFIPTFDNDALTTALNITLEIYMSKFIKNCGKRKKDNKYSILYWPRLNSVVITGCELLSVVEDVVNDVKFVSNGPVNGLVSDFTVTGVVLTLPSTVNTRNSNTISKYKRTNAMTQLCHLENLTRFSNSSDVSHVNSANALPSRRKHRRRRWHVPKHIKCVDSVRW